MVRVTVGQWDSSTPESLISGVEELKLYLKKNPTDILLLPELPFTDWFPSLSEYDQVIWEEAVDAHLHWIDRLSTFGVPTIIGTRPVNKNGNRYNSSWIWHNGQLKDLHYKNYLPEEEGFWEATWYDAGEGDLTVAKIGELRIGFLICTEMWFMKQARDYSKEGIHLLVVPRSTDLQNVEKWITGGRTAAIISGAFCLSSNHYGQAADGITQLGGTGWIINPDGQLLARTSDESPWQTLEIDERTAEIAKTTYPRYVVD